jgi:sugar phosphate permease
MRFILGIVQSVSKPVSLTLLADYFPQNKRSTINSIYSSGMYVGSALASFNIFLIS